MRRPFHGTDIPGLQSTAVPQPPAPAVEGDPCAGPYAEGYGDGHAAGYAEGYEAAMRERAEGPGLITRYVLGVRALVEAPAPKPTTEKE